jgi:hypothetical protein
MKTHTPGPWLAIPTTAISRKPDSLRMDIVTKTGEWTPAFIAGDILPEDARLIASAPEMLAALELIYSNAGESPEWIRARIGPVIEKAIGESESLARKIKAKGNE